MNKLYYGDNLDVLRRFIKDESVDLCYIDPPFNSKRNYNQIYNNIGTEDRAQAQAFMDTWTWDDHAIECRDNILSNKNNVQTSQSIALINGLEKVLGKGSLFAYIVSMSARIAEIHRVLKPTGSFYLHCDPSASHYLKIVCDALFCSRGGNYLNEIVWRRASTVKGNAGQGSKMLGNNTDSILFYSKTDNHKFNPEFLPYSEEYLRTHYRFTEQGTGRRYRLISMIGPGGAAKGNPSYEVLGVTRYWRYSKLRMQELIDAGLVVQTTPGTVPVRKQYLDDGHGVAVQSLWDDVEALGPASGERLGYPTQKPEELLSRIVGLSTEENDVVLDAFCGCGTTIAVAQLFKRQWIGIDITYQSMSLVLKRLRKMFDQQFGDGDPKTKLLMDSIELHGVPRDMEAVDALIHKKDDRVWKEFEKWAVLTYSDNRAIINEKKGADKGIDGIAYTRNFKGDVLPVIISVKSGNVGSAMMRDLRGTIEREGAACGILITRQEPKKPMLLEAKEAGQFKPEYHTAFDRLQIVTVQQILDGARMSLPLMEEVTKKAQKAKGDTQPSLLSD